MKRLGLLVLIALGGCDLYFGDGDDDPCAYTDYGTGAEPAPNMLRNPYTGTCESFGGYYPPCDDKCGPCVYPPAQEGSDGGVPPQSTDGGSAPGTPDGMTGTGGSGSGTADLAPLPNWAQCYSSCDGLDERSCIAQTGCQAAYDEFGPYADAPGVQNFKGCWATAPQYTAPALSCWDLGAAECSQREDCSPYFTSYGATDALVAPEFARCAPEPTTSGCAAVDCGPGSHCEEQCYPCDGQNGPCDAACAPMCVPDSYSCAAVDCGPGYTCVEQCNTMDPTAGGMLPPGECYPTCVPTTTGDPGACTGPVNCLAGEPACPTGTVAGILDGCWTGYCIPEAACGPSDPGSCGEATCDAAPPACPANTVAGIGASGCYTGYCIPASACPTALCEALTTESACASRFDCTAVYTGDNCTCTPNGCSCTDLAFARCESWGDQPMPL